MHAYEVRALPRKRKEIEDDDQQPLFLKKVFSLISTCPPEIGGWCDHGETFVVKDSDRFAAEIIPTAFKHSKFSSFVRQLNFYGFRKIKVDNAHHANWWEFRHPYFRRDEPQMISKIKKSMHFDSNGEAVFNDPASAVKEVMELKSRVAALETTISDLTGLVQTLLNDRPVMSFVESESFKRRKFSFDELSTDSESNSVAPSVGPAVSAPELPIVDPWENMDGLFSEFEFKSIPRFDSAPFEESTFPEMMIPAVSSEAVHDISPLEIVAPPVVAAVPVLSRNDARMQGMIQTLAQAIGTAASMSAPTAPSCALQGSAANGSSCPCANCQLVSLVPGDSSSAQVPAVAYSLATATVSALCMKYGDAVCKLLVPEQSSSVPVASSRAF